MSQDKLPELSLELVTSTPMVCRVPIAHLVVSRGEALGTSKECLL